jgi:hypothetical protein
MKSANGMSQALASGLIVIGWQEASRNVLRLHIASIVTMMYCD